MNEHERDINLAESTPEYARQIESELRSVRKESEAARLEYQKKINELEARFSNAMEVSPSGMMMVCIEGVITQVNSELERIFGYEANELVGQPLELLISSGDRQQHQGYRQSYFNDPYILRRMGESPYVWGQRKNGERIPLSIHVRPISTPKGMQAIASVVDVSQHQKLEFSLREQVEQRDRFLATLSHELRGPLNAIVTAALVLELSANQSTEAAKPCQVIRQQSSQMSLLLDDLLDVARLTQGKIKLRLEVIDLNEVCQESIEALQPMITSHKHRLQIDFPTEPTWIKADRVRILQVIGNLLTNAIKYTDPGGFLELSVRQEDSKVVVRVKDNGRGIPADLIKCIFDMFVQGDDTLGRSEGGMGVGLALVRSLVEMHQGTIDVASEGIDKGSEFAVRLPKTSDRPFHSIPSETAELVTRRIVIVEDDDDAREMMKQLLVLQGHDVVASCDNGISGLDAVVTLRPDVAILDIGIPELDGHRLARKIRDELGRSIILVALTGYGRIEDQLATKLAGFDWHLVKPIDIGQLTKILGF